MNWCFAIVNNKLAEIYFKPGKNKIKFLGHTYVQKSQLAKYIHLNHKPSSSLKFCPLQPKGINYHYRTPTPLVVCSEII